MNPRPNNPNPEFNPFSYDPKSLRNLLVQLQQNPNIQHFQQHHQTSNHLQTFNPVLLPTPNLGSNLILCHRVNLITRSCWRHKTLKNAKKVRKTNNQPEQGRVVVQWHRNNGLTMKKSLSEDATWTNSRTKPEWGRVFSGVTIVGVKGFQRGDDVTGNFSGEGFSVG
ncbi:hypothetical protein R6Q57_017600 [Mikania cordata]